MKQDSFRDRLHARMDSADSLLVVGLDSDISLLPSSVRNGSHPQFTFNKTIIRETHSFVCAYKLNTAFYEERGEDGIADLKATCSFLRDEYPDIPIILDAKRGDIGNTNRGYVGFAFDYLMADAITLHPYLGAEALAPFLDRKEKGCIILVRTSNPGAGELQDLPVSGAPLYLVLARKIAETWNRNGNCLLVVGATYPKELAQIRSVVGAMDILVPGVGSQGGDLDAAARSGLLPDGTGLLINVSRAVLFDADPQAKARAFRDQINAARGIVRP